MTLWAGCTQIVKLGRQIKGITQALLALRGSLTVRSTGTVGKRDLARLPQMTIQLGQTLSQHSPWYQCSATKRPRGEGRGGGIFPQCLRLSNPPNNEIRPRRKRASRSRFGGVAADGALNHSGLSAWGHVGWPERTERIRSAPRTNLSTTQRSPPQHAWRSLLGTSGGQMLSHSRSFLQTERGQGEWKAFLKAFLQSCSSIQYSREGWWVMTLDYQLVQRTVKAQ